MKHLPPHILHAMALRPRKGYDDGGMPMVDDYGRTTDLPSPPVPVAPKWSPSSTWVDGDPIPSAPPLTVHASAPPVPAPPSDDVNTSEAQTSGLAGGTNHGFDKWANAISTVAGNMLGGVKDAATLPGDVYAGRVDPMSDQGIARANNLAGMLTGNGMGAAEDGAAGIFGGRLSKTADHAALAKAQDMHAAGAPRDAIWNDTGWFQGPDKQWRYEIPDDKSALNPKAVNDLTQNEYHGATQRTAPGVLDHADLYKAYPNINLVDVDARYNPGFRNPNGAYNAGLSGRGGRPQITISTNSLDGDRGVRSIALHELQHGIQQEEGFGRGSSPDYAANDLYSSLNSQLSSLAKRMDGAKGDEKAALKAQYDSVMNTKLGINPRDLYNRTSGEVEARNVQTRRDLTPEQRRASPPWETQDVPDDQQIVRMGSSGPQMSVGDDPLQSALSAVPPKSFTAYHGSPHSFDRFDISNIGTGEGAQAYGHGLYFAGNEGVARSYRDNLSKPSISHPVLGDNLSLDTIVNAAANAAEKAAPRLSPSKHAEIGANVTEALRNGDDIGHFRNLVNNSDWSGAEKQAWNAALNKGQEFKVGEKPNGSMYQVAINADPEHFLDWDKPLSEQHPVVQEALRGTPLDVDQPVAAPLKRAFVNDMHGGDVAGKDRATPAEVAQALSAKGIPGIKYLDHDSRGRDGGTGTHNFVVFNDKNIDILRKYGLAGVMAGGAGAGAAANLAGSDKPHMAHGGRISGSVLHAMSLRPHYADGGGSSVLGALPTAPTLPTGQAIPALPNTADQIIPGGNLSPTDNFGTYGLAQSMESSGAPRALISAQTGWDHGQDGTLRYQGAQAPFGSGPQLRPQYDNGGAVDMRPAFKHGGALHPLIQAALGMRPHFDDGGSAGMGGGDPTGGGQNGGFSAGPAGAPGSSSGMGSPGGGFSSMGSGDPTAGQANGSFSAGPAGAPGSFGGAGGNTHASSAPSGGFSSLGSGDPTAGMQSGSFTAGVASAPGGGIGSGSIGGGLAAGGFGLGANGTGGVGGAVSGGFGPGDPTAGAQSGSFTAGVASSPSGSYTSDHGSFGAAPSDSAAPSSPAPAAPVGGFDTSGFKSKNTSSAADTSASSMAAAAPSAPSGGYDVGQGMASAQAADAAATPATNPMQFHGVPGGYISGIGSYSDYGTNPGPMATAAAAPTAPAMGGFIGGINGYGDLAGPSFHNQQYGNDTGPMGLASQMGTAASKQGYGQDAMGESQSAVMSGAPMGPANGFSDGFSMPNGANPTTNMFSADTTGIRSDYTAPRTSYNDPGISASSVAASAPQAPSMATADPWSSGAASGDDSLANPAQIGKYAVRAGPQAVGDPSSITSQPNGTVQAMVQGGIRTDPSIGFNTAANGPMGQQSPYGGLSEAASLGSPIGAPAAAPTDTAPSPTQVAAAAPQAPSMDPAAQMGIAAAKTEYGAPVSFSGVPDGLGYTAPAPDAYNVNPNDPNQAGAFVPGETYQDPATGKLMTMGPNGVAVSAEPATATDQAAAAPTAPAPTTFAPDMKAWNAIRANGMPMGSADTAAPSPVSSLGGLIGSAAAAEAPSAPAVNAAGVAAANAAAGYADAPAAPSQDGINFGEGVVSALHNQGYDAAVSAFGSVATDAAVAAMQAASAPPAAQPSAPEAPAPAPVSTAQPSPSEVAAAAPQAPSVTYGTPENPAPAVAEPSPSQVAASAPVAPSAPALADNPQVGPVTAEPGPKTLHAPSMTSSVIGSMIAGPLGGLAVTGLNYGMDKMGWGAYSPAGMVNYAASHPGAPASAAGGPNGNAGIPQSHLNPYAVPPVAPAPPPVTAAPPPPPAPYVPPPVAHGGYRAPYNPQPYHYHVNANAGPPPYNPYTDPVVMRALGIG